MLRIIAIGFATSNKRWPCPCRVPKHSLIVLLFDSDEVFRFLWKSTSQYACFMQHFAITSSHVRGSAAMQFFALEHFATHLNETFAVTLDSQGQAPFVLVEARPLPMMGAPMPGMVRSPFSLLFRNESAILLPQKIYQMTHVAMGEFGIFLVPIARDRDGFIYQAVFN
jgi:hypothetical protein